MSNEKNEIRIGEVLIGYNEDGTVAGVLFTPASLKLAGVMSQIPKLFKDTNGKQDREQIKKSAELVFGAWFNQMNEFELADREKYEIVSEIGDCEEYPDGGVKSCLILFTFRGKEVKSDFSAN
jgi:uncharacterized protein YuzE